MFTFKSPAKLNLFFRVLSKRSDGYHEIASIYQAIDCFDRISIEVTGRDQFSCNDPTLVFDDNLILKALRLFRGETGVHQKVSIHLEKKIPIGSGLGGGSSNSATTLWGLNQIFQTNLSKQFLMSLSKSLGSDVPFFFSTGSALCTGRGEKVVSMNLPKYQGWVISPKIKLSTPSVYKEVCLNKVSNLPVSDLIQSFKDGYPIFINDLESAALTVEPPLKEIKEGSQATLTGSGSSFFSFKKPRYAGGDIFPFRSVFSSVDGWF